MNTSDSLPRAARFLEGVLLLVIVAHGAAMLSIALLLLPGIPGGSNVDVAARAGYVAGHPWLWRLGWLPWQITALSDLLFALALLRTRWIPRLPAVLTLLATLAAVLIEQPAELRWISTGVVLAQTAVQTGDLTDYLRLETNLYLLTAGWAATFYTIAALGWSWCFIASGVWNRFLTWLSIITWTLLLVVGLGPLLPQVYRLANGLVAAGNALGFVLLMIWLCVATELVLRRSRPTAAHGRMAPWRYPDRSFLSYPLNILANSRLGRAFGEWLPPLAFVSDITHVIYVNYLVEVRRLEPLVPWGLELQRLGPEQNYALFTHLTYRHGHFGPRLFGPLRRFLPSPVQSNWRIHVRNPQTGVMGIYFVSTALSHTLPAVLARLLSEGIPMHVAQCGQVTAQPDGSFQIQLSPGLGSAPDLSAQLWPTPEPVLVPPWTECFADFRAMLAYCVPQDRAMSSQPWYGRITRQEIQLNIPLEACQPLTAGVVSEAAFRFDREEYDYLPDLVVKNH